MVAHQLRSAHVRVYRHEQVDTTRCRVPARVWGGGVLLPVLRRGASQHLYPMVMSVPNDGPKIIHTVC